jgi:hypothetical protein
MTTKPSDGAVAGSSAWRSQPEVCKSGASAHLQRAAVRGQGPMCHRHGSVRVLRPQSTGMLADQNWRHGTSHCEVDRTSRSGCSCACSLCSSPACPDKHCLLDWSRATGIFWRKAAPAATGSLPVSDAAGPAKVTVSGEEAATPAVVLPSRMRSRASVTMATPSWRWCTCRTSRWSQ